MTAEEKTPQEKPSASLLGNLKALREEITNSLDLELEVPRWFETKGIRVIVRYKPLEHEYIVKTMKTAEKAGQIAEAIIWANADLLVKACTAVFALVDGKEYSLRPGDENGDFTTFDADLGANLGVENPTARRVCRELFLTDGDLITQADRLVDWSGYRKRQADEDFAGE